MTKSYAPRATAGVQTLMTVGHDGLADLDAGHLLKVSLYGAGGAALAMALKAKKPIWWGAITAGAALIIGA